MTLTGTSSTGGGLMTPSSTNETLLFSGSVPLTLGQALEPKTLPISVRVSVVDCQGSDKSLQVQLTDDHDPFFLFQLDVRGQDFHALRSEQNILVDFQQFPIKFIELLQECIKSQGEEHPKFLCKLVSNPLAPHAQFSIIETNSFRNITHLSLSFVPGNDAAVKNYLAGLVKQFKLDISHLKEQLDATGSALSMTTKESQVAVETLSHDLEALKLSASQQKSELELNYTKQLSDEREKFARERESARLEAERSLRLLEAKHQEMIQSLTQKLAALTESLSNTQQKLTLTQSTLSTLERTKDALQSEHESLKRDYERTQYRLQDAEKDKRGAEVTIERLMEKISSLEKLERQAVDGARASEDRLSALSEQKVKMEETVELYKTQNGRLEESLKKASEEINKGNDIIRRLQAELKSSKAKIKLKNTVTIQQEKLLDERAESLQLLQKEASEARTGMEKMKAQQDELVRKVTELEKKLEESKTIIQDNNHVIEWLHKQLNEDALSRPLGLSMGPTIDFSKYATNTSVSPSALPSDSKTRASPPRFSNRFAPVPSENRPPSNSYGSQLQGKSPSQLQQRSSPSQQNPNQSTVPTYTPQAFSSATASFAPQVPNYSTAEFKYVPQDSSYTPTGPQYRGGVDGSKMSNLATSTTHLGQSAYEVTMKNPLKPSVGLKSNYF